MARIFFSYASEDAAAVAAVYAAVVKQYPQHEPWIDRYEIVAGNSLLQKIAEAMDAAEKFFVFLSAVSVAKPWVERELRRAIMREIDQVDPDFIVPVKLGGLTKLPPFLEDKRYIDLEKLRQGQWLAEFDASITGTPRRDDGRASIDNVRYGVEYGPEGTHVALVTFAAKAWAEKISFVVETSEDMVPQLPGPPLMALDDMLVGPVHALSNVRLVRQARKAAISADAPDLQPGRPFTLRLEFPPGKDAKAAIVSVMRWDGDQGRRKTGESADTVTR